MIRFCLSAAMVFSLAIGSHRACGRQTEDAAEDVIAALLSAERFEEAEWLCRFEQDRSGSDSLRHARWSVLLSTVVGQREANALFEVKPSDLTDELAAAIQRATAPVDALAAEGDDSPFAVFVQATMLKVRQKQVRAAVIITTVAPTPQVVIDDLLTRISRLQRDSAALQRKARDRWSARQAALDGDPAANDNVLPAGEYDRLIGELAVEQIALALLQTELFPRSGDDFRGAAADAVAVAEAVLPTLADRTAAKRAATGLLAKALLRADDIARAGQLIRQAAETPAETQADVATWTALAVEYQLARGELKTAQTICDAYYRLAIHANSDPSDYLEMDFAQLEVFLATETNPQQLTGWLEKIGKRGGAFAKRRAEAMVIESLGSGGANPSTAPSSTAVGPALIAMQGEDALRRDEPQRAAALLRRAALATLDADRSLNYATKSAAAAVSAGDVSTAGQVLIEAAKKHPQAESAPALMMQAALLRSEQIRSASGDDAKRRLANLEMVLTELAQIWPQSSAAFKANRWRCRILTSAGRREEAAGAALEFLMLRKQIDQVLPTARLWFDFVATLPETAATERLSTFAAALDEVAREQPELKPAVNRVAAWLFDPDALVGRVMDVSFSGESNAGDPNGSFLESLLRFRQGDEASISPDAVAQDLRDRSRWRLERDASRLPKRRQAIGRVLLQFPDSTAWQTAVASFWISADRDSITTLKKLALAETSEQTRMRRAIDVLGQSQITEARMAAVELADRLTMTLPIGTDAWYEAKLVANDLLVRSGKEAEASKRARYVLLVRPPGKRSLRERFEAFADD